MSKLAGALIVSVLGAAALRGAEADELVAKHLAARGGAARIRAVRSQLAVGRVTTPHGEHPLRLEWRRPDAVRIEVTMQGMPMIQAFDGATGWLVVPMLGSTLPQLASEEDVARLRRAADFDGPLLDAAAKGHRVELLGRGSFEGTPVDRLRVTRADGEVVELDLDAETHLLLRESGVSRLQGFEARYAVTYGAFREVAGLTIPFERVRTTEGVTVPQVTTFASVELDIELDDGRFAMPGDGNAGREGEARR